MRWPGPVQAAPDMTALAAPLSDLPHDVLRNTAIRLVQTAILDVPTIRRHALSNTEIRHQSYVQVTMTLDNGVVGYGEASTLGGPRWAEESVEAIKANIDTYLAPALIGQPVAGIQAATLRMNAAAKRNFAAKSALNAAMLDALGKTLNVPAVVLLGGAVRDRFPVIWALASGDATQEADEARRWLDAGLFNRFKVKLGFADPQTDIARLAHLRDSLPDDTMLIADVNQAWDEADCLRWFPALAALGVTLIEQPVPAAQIDAMARLAARTDIPLMLDEAVFTPAEALHATAAGAGSVVSLKLCKHGSAHELQRVAGIAGAAGMQLYGGCLLESSLGAAAHLAVFATLPHLHWGTEHFGPRILTQDTTLTGLRYHDFHVHLPDGPGMGVVPDPDKIAAFQRKL